MQEDPPRQAEIALPAFEMDCRDWLVATPDDAGLPDEVAGAPLVAVLSTAVFDEGEFQPASAVLTLGLLEEDPPAGVPSGESVASELVDPDDPDSLRYLVPAPTGRLALVAEFAVEGSAGAEMRRRIQALMTSFRWAA